MRDEDPVPYRGKSCLLSPYDPSREGNLTSSRGNEPHPMDAITRHLPSSLQGYAGKFKSSMKHMTPSSWQCNPECEMRIARKFLLLETDATLWGAVDGFEACWPMHLFSSSSPQEQEVDRIL